MPSLSPTMTEGTIVKWTKNEGDPVNAGDVVCEIQTDKAVVSLEVDDDGTLAKIFMPADSGLIKVGTLIAMVAEDGEDWKEIQSKGAPSASAESSSESSEAVAESSGPSGGSTPGVEVKMPSLSPTMTEGTIVKWCKKEGDVINAGDVLCEIQTDKAVVSMEHDDDGILAKILVQEGSVGIQVGTLIALAVNEGEDWKDVQIPGSSSAAPKATEKKVKKGPSGGNTPGTQIKMPSLSPTMTEGTIVKWCVKEGEAVAAGEVLCEVQTDKAVVSMEVDDDMILAKILIPEGDAGVKVGTLIALSVEEGQDWKDVQIPAEEDDDTPVPTDSNSQPAAETSQEVSEAHVVPIARAGPAVMLLCAKYGIDPSKVTSTGPRGLIKSDVLKYIKDNNLTPIKIAAKPTTPAKAPEVAKVPPPQTSSVQKPRSGYTDIPLTSMRAVIAKRLSQSKSTSPHGYSTAGNKKDFLASDTNFNQFILIIS